MDRMLQLLYGSASRQTAAGNPNVDEASQASLSAGSSSAAESSEGRRASGRGAPMTAGAAAGDSSATAAAGVAPGGRDLESHRLIEKRRRDRMNSALTELCRLIPEARAKQSQGRIEKAEIIEMATHHITELTSLVSTCKAEPVGHQFAALWAENYQQGFLDCTRATLGYLSDLEQAPTSTDGLCSHLYSYMNSAMQKFAVAHEGEHSAAPTPLDFPTQNPQYPQVPHHLMESLPRQHQHQPKLPRLHRSLDSFSTASADDIKHQFYTASTAAGTTADAVISPPHHLPQQYQQHQSHQHQPQSLKKSKPSSSVSSNASSSSNSGGPTGSGGQQHLPGFVLHPSGTHYLPLVLPRLALGSEELGGKLDDDDEGGEAGRTAEGRAERSAAQDVLHPISIPVNFRSARRLRLGKRKRSSTECWEPAGNCD